MKPNDVKKTVLVTGGAGYIGTHTITSLLLKEYSVVVFDNLSNSSSDVINQIELISNKSIEFIEGDIRDKQALEAVFMRYSFDAVIHFAGLKSVGESVSNPLLYYENNVIGTLILLEVMKKYNVKSIVFSSSATVYGNVAVSPLKESLPMAVPVNPYGMSKLMVENILNDLFLSDKEWSICILRYFNPVGAHGSGLIGESPIGTPNNLMPLVSQIAAGLRECIDVYGDDYNTPDGTGIRDYIHVMDLADGHVKAVNKVLIGCELVTVNLGTGKGYSVLELIDTFESISAKKIKRKFVGRRTGDVEISVACPKYAKILLGWKAKYNLRHMCEDSWWWQRAIMRKSD